MKARLKPLVLPLFMVLISLWLIYANWIDPNPTWRFPQAEAAGPLFLLIGVPWLLYATYRALRPHQVAVGTFVTFGNSNVGFLAEMQGDICTVTGDGKAYRLNRYELSPLWTPKVGDRVWVRPANAPPYSGLVREVQGEKARLQLSDEREQWTSMWDLVKA